MAFSVSGLNSGIDYSQLINALINAERQPIVRLESQKKSYNDKIGIYNTFSSRLADLKTAADTLKTAGGFFAKKGSSSDASAVEVSVTNSAAVGAYSITDITSLAEADQFVHGGVADKAASINGSGSAKTFVYSYAGGSNVTVEVAAGTTLEQLAGLINSDSDNPGVTATIVNDGTNYRLVLTGKNSGSAKTIAIGDGTLDGAGGTVDFRGSTADLYTHTKTAGNASFKVDGISITSTTNTVSTVIAGVTFTLKKANIASPPSAKITVSDDTASVKKKIEDFVSAYNKVASYVSENSAYDTETSKGGAFTGEQAPRSIVSGLRSIVGDSVAGLPEAMRVLSQLGITTDYHTGALTIDGAKLDERLSSDIQGAYKIFSDASDGIAVRVSSYAADATRAASGSIAVRKKGIQNVISKIDNDIERMERRLEKMEADLTRQFANLEALLGGMNSQGSFLLNQLSLLSR